VKFPSLAIRFDRTFVLLAAVGLAAYLVTGYLWLVLFGLDQVIFWAAFGIWLLNLVLAFFSQTRLPAYSYLLLSSPLLIIALLYAILLQLR